MYFLYKRGNVLKGDTKILQNLFFFSLTLILKYKYHYASSFSIFWKPKHKHMLIISVSIKSHAHRHTCTRTDGCYEYQLSWPPSILSSVLDSLRSYATQNVRLLPYDISLMPCVFVSYFEQQHQCRTCQCRRVNKPQDFRVFAFLRQRFVPAPVEGGAETCCALGFLVHIASNSANSKQDMKDEVWMRQDKRWEATGLMRVAKASGPSCQRGWGASVLYRCWTPLCGC